MKHTIYFVRHGETDWNRAGRFQGHKDIPLNDLGRDQARRNGRSLKQNLPTLDLPFLASPMKRTSETMELIRGELGLPVSGYDTDDRLKEISFGEFEGLTADEIDAQRHEEITKRRIDKYNYIPPNGESYAMLTERVRGVVDSIKEDMVIVSHGGTSRAFRGILYGLSDVETLELATPQDQVMKCMADKVMLI